MCVKFGDCCPDYQDVCSKAFDNRCERKAKATKPVDDDEIHTDPSDPQNSSFNSLGKLKLSTFIKFNQFEIFK